MSDDVHVVEQGDGWEVRRIGDSMPLGSYLTRGEAEERARAQAEEDGVRVIDHDLDIEVDVEVDPDIQTGAAPAGTDPREGDAPTG